MLGPADQVASAETSSQETASPTRTAAVARPGSPAGRSRATPAPANADRAVPGRAGRPQQQHGDRPSDVRAGHRSPRRSRASRPPSGRRGWPPKMPPNEISRASRSHAARSSSRRQAVNKPSAAQNQGRAGRRAPGARRRWPGEPRGSRPSPPPGSRALAAPGLVARGGPDSTPGSGQDLVPGAQGRHLFAADHPRLSSSAVRRTSAMWWAECIRGMNTKWRRLRRTRAERK